MTPPIATRPLAAFVALLLLPTIVLGQETDDPDDPNDSPALYGGVVDGETGAPLPGVTVTLTTDELDAPLVRTTNAEGRFAFGEAPDGTYDLSVERIGYGPVVHEIGLSGHTDIEVRVELSPQAIQLEPLVVEIRRPGFLVRQGFYERMERGVGQFITREEIESRDPMRASDLLRRIPPVQLSRSVGPGAGVITMRRGCQPSVYLDGVRIPPPAPLDDIVSVEAVESIEVYRGLETPERFRHGDQASCGAVAVWTRRGEPEGGSRSTLKRSLVAAGLALGAMLMTR